MGQRLLLGRRGEHAKVGRKVLVRLQIATTCAPLTHRFRDALDHHQDGNPEATRTAGAATFEEFVGSVRISALVEVAKRWEPGSQPQVIGQGIELRGPFDDD